MQDLRVKVGYKEHKVLKGAQGVKICAKDLEKAIAGLNCLVAYYPDEVEICKEEMDRRLQSALNAIKLKDRGVFVQASTLGSLEALLEFLKSSKIPVRLTLASYCECNTFMSGFGRKWYNFIKSLLLDPPFFIN